MKTIQKALYGNVALYRGYCYKCQRFSFVIDGILQCCNKDISTPTREIKKRMSGTHCKRTKHISRKTKDRILNEQDFKCIYCGCYINHKAVFDHFIPWVYSQHTDYKNMVASCIECNAHKSSKCFNNLDEAKAYILKKRKVQTDISHINVEPRPD